MLAWEIVSHPDQAPEAYRAALEGAVLMQASSPPPTAWELIDTPARFSAQWR